MINIKKSDTYCNVCNSKTGMINVISFTQDNVSINVHLCNKCLMELDAAILSRRLEMITEVEE